MKQLMMSKWVLVCSLILVVVFAAGCLPTTPGGPIAYFSADVTSGAAPLTVQFTDLSIPGSSPITSWYWLFGDGSKETSTEQNPIHTYNTTGSYNVSLTVTTANGENTELQQNFINVTSSGEGEGEGETETVMLSGNVPLEMVWIPAGTFMMGRYPGEKAVEVKLTYGTSSADEDPQHSVTLSSGFWMGKYEVTKAQWTAVMGTTPWSGQDFVLDDLESPAIYISWTDAQVFITALNTFTGKTFQLPSEAQWEYACRAGTTTRFYWGDDWSYIGAYAWYFDNSALGYQQYAHIVGTRLPNAWGLYDMSGNAFEWCQDWWHDNYTGAPTDGSAWESPAGSNRVLRGGSWADREYTYFCRSAGRYSNFPGVADYRFGFRIVRTP